MTKDACLERRFCQSCGMPLKINHDELLGTNADGSYNKGFCYYCLKNGEYTVDYTLEQMVNVWVKYTDKYNEYTDASYTPESLHKLLMKRLPALRRWRKKESTRNIHAVTINRIQIYIQQHLFDQISPKELAIISGMSYYHFRDVFHEVTGENIAGYIQRLQLEYAAFRLIMSDIPIQDIAIYIGFATVSGFSKAFNRYFGLSPKRYRKKYFQGLPQEENNALITFLPEIKYMPELPIICLPVKDAYKHMKHYHDIWKQLSAYALKNRLYIPGQHYLSLSMDDPMITKVSQCRFYIGITTSSSLHPPVPFDTMSIPGATYAVFRHTGSHSTLPETYRQFYLRWLPGSGYRQSTPLTFEKYLNTPGEVSDEELETEIYIPIEK